jgi:Methyltransferase FkbM domain/Magnesium chelatase, subunit ChlI
MPIWTTCRRGANARCAADYQTRISGPLIDRIDLHIEVPAVTAADLLLPPPAEGSREVAERVAAARERQAARDAAIGLPHLRSNAVVSGTVPEDVARPDASGLRFCVRQLMPGGCRRAAITACRASPARSPISTAPRRSAASISPSYRALTDEVRRAAWAAQEKCGAFAAAFNFPRLNLIKMDVEGMELEALAGAANSIRAPRPMMLVEAIKVDAGKLRAQSMIRKSGYRFSEKIMLHQGSRERDDDST